MCLKFHVLKTLNFFCSFNIFSECFHFVKLKVSLIKSFCQCFKHFYSALQTVQIQGITSNELKTLLVKRLHQKNFNTDIDLVFDM